MTIDQIITITQGMPSAIFDDSIEIKNIIIDSRKPFPVEGTLFFAIRGTRHDGHDFINDLYHQGCRNFVVEYDIALPEANTIKVDDAVAALQAIARHHREQFHKDVVGITGSNGKTIVKEWLYTCLAPIMKITRSPHSYNSQVGVPLSIWHLSPADDLAIFEAGISTTGEMVKLANSIKPTIGIFTNLGSAHDEGFVDRAQKFSEKALLFDKAEKIIYNSDQSGVSFGDRGISWGKKKGSAITIKESIIRESNTHLTLWYKNDTVQVILPFTDHPSIENSMHCIAFMLIHSYHQEVIQSGVDRLQQLAMRLELKQAINNSYLIDDTYNNDLGGLEQALSFLASQKQRPKKVVILSDLLQSGLDAPTLYAKVAHLISSADVALTVGVGPAMKAHQALFKGTTRFFSNTAEAINQLDLTELTNSIILIKGARSFEFERMSRVLEEKIHRTVLEINMDALTNNLNFYRSVLPSTTKLMVMVKAFAYGSGSFEVANLLQFHRVDYLGVAYADEGIQLRQNGIHLPIMIMNPNDESFDAIIKYNLEPVIYHITLLHRLTRYLNNEQVAIHLEIETGMNRLGLKHDDLESMLKVLKTHPNITVKSVFSHLAGADEELHNAYSHQQAKIFDDAANQLSNGLGYQPIRHLVNSAGILRFPEYHFDMVRLGVGLYGIAPNDQWQGKLTPISMLKTVVSQVHQLKATETVGYGRKGKANQALQVATIAIGYADGFSRAFSNGVGEVVIRGKRVPVIGNVCMDMTMVDVTGMMVQEGDEVEVFGSQLSIGEMAEKIGTIPYEILTSVSHRVKRLFYTN